MFIRRLICGAFVFLVSTGFMAAFCIDSARLRNWCAPLIPMNFFSALALAASAFCLFLLDTRHEKILRWISRAVLALASVFIAEYLFETNFGIDRILPHFDRSLLSLHAGRMAPDSAICFFFFHATLFFHLRARNNPEALSFFPLNAVFLPAVAILAWMCTPQSPLQHPLGSFSQMSMFSAVCFSALGLGALPESIRKQEKMPYALCAVLILASLVFWQGVLQNEVAKVRLETSAKSTELKNQIDFALRERVTSLKRMGQRLSFRDTPTREAWQADAQLYIDHLRGIRAISVTNDRYRIKWIQPEVGNEKVLGYDMSSEPTRKQVLDHARSSQDYAITPVLELRQGGDGFIIAIPLEKSRLFNGFLVAAFDPRAFLAGVLRTDGYEIEISEKGRPLYANLSNTRDFPKRWAVESRFPVGITSWDLKIIPTLDTLSRHESRLPLTALLVSVMGALLLSAMLNLALRSAEKSGTIEEQRLFLHSIIDHLPVGITCKDSEDHLRYVLWNRASEKIFGISREKALRQNDVEMSDGKTITEMRDLDFLQSGQRAEFLEGSASEVNPSEKLLQTHLIPIKGLSGRPRFLLGISEDITQRILDERKLRSTKDALEALISFSPLPILTLDTDGRVRIWNAACEKVFGWKREEVEGRALPFVTEQQRPSSEAIIRNILKTRTPVQAEVQRVRKDGTAIDVSIAAICLEDAQHLPTGLMAIISDISQRKAIDRAMDEARVGAEKMAELKSNFLANISHEIRTPLNGIIGMTDLILDTPLQPEQIRYAEIVRSSGATLLHLINDLLDFSKIEAGGLELESIHFSIPNLIETQAELLAAKAREKNLSISTYIDPELRGEALGDPSRLAQILANLIGNAIKFTAEGGIGVSALSTGAGVRFEVKDSGMGISPEVLSRLFQPFSQANATISRKFGGTGLGLSICKQLVEAMGGRIGVESSNHQGSTFWFVVPLNIFAPVPTLGDRSVSEQTKILVVDEDPLTRDNVTAYSDSWNFESATASTLVEGRSKLGDAVKSKVPFHFLLLSERMSPDLANLTQTLRREYPGLSVILMREFESGSALPSLPIVGSINKPFKQSTLFDLLTRKAGNPASTPSIVSSSLALPIRGESGAVRILVADDITVNQMLCLKMLEKLGYAGTAVATGKEVLEALNLHPYDLILMDCQMPEMDGFEATRAIRLLSDPALSRVPIIALTANAMAGDEKACLDSGMNDYLSKPLKLDRLSAKLERWLPRRAS